MGHFRNGPLSIERDTSAQMLQNITRAKTQKTGRKASNEDRNICLNVEELLGTGQVLGHQDK